MQQIKTCYCLLLTVYYFFCIFKKEMKIKKTTPLLFFFLFSIIFFLDTTVAQTPVKIKNEFMGDEKYLVGFDEKAIRDELKQKGVSKKNFAEIIHGRKHKYVAAQKESKKTNPYFPLSNTTKISNPPGCLNADFEDYNFSYWTGGTGDCTNYPMPTVWNPGFISGPFNTNESDGYSQHTILNNAGAYDLNAGLTGGIPNIPYVAPGSGAVSVRLGNSHIYQGTEFLKYSLAVTASNNTFSYQYAIVLEDPPGHLPSEQPRFIVNVYDGSGVAIPGPCMSYSIDGDAASADTTFKPFFDSYGNVQGYYKKWATMIVDLTSYIGQTVVIEFITQDCTLSGHFGYAYIDATCLQMQSTLPFCQNDSIGTLTAPEGYNAYQWFDSSGNPILGANATSLNITNPVNGSTYTVAMYSSSGCSHSLTTTIVIDSSSVLFNNIVSNPICYEDNGGYAYVNQLGGGGPFIYTWINSDGIIITPSGSSDSLQNIPPGEYYLIVQSANGCMSKDTFQIIQPPPIITYSGIPICPNETSVTLTSPIGSNFQWYDPIGNLISGATTSTYAAITPAVGQTYSVNYSPPSGCDITNVDSFYLYQLNQAPSGVSNVTCFGYNDGAAFTTVPTSNPIGAAGPFTFSWTYSGSSSVISITDSLNNIFAGTYYVTTTSAAGCSVSDTIIVIELPNTFDTLKITMKYCPDDEMIVLHAPLGYNTYAWYANQNATGPVLSTFDSLIVSPPVFGAPYTVFMPNPNIGDCNIILKVNLDYSPPPAIPGFITSTNVFTPNGDGVNDLFLLNENSYRYIKDLHIQVFNRWGTKVFEADELSDRWDGKINGSNAAEGVYYWMASYSQACLLNPPTLTAYGFVQIFR